MLAKKTTKIYSVGIYARLSVDGSERKNESIETQLQMAKDFIRQQKDMVLFDCYTDRGKTGTNFAVNIYSGERFRIESDSYNRIVLTELEIKEDSQSGE